MVYWTFILPGLPNFGGWNPETIVEVFIVRNILNKKRGEEGGRNKFQKEQREYLLNRYTPRRI